MEFKDRLKELRLLKGISQIELAEKVNVGKSTIGAYETGDRMPGREALRKLADFFMVDVDYLLGNESRSTYYMDPEVAFKAQELYIDPEARILLDAKRDLSEEDLNIVINMVKALKAKEGK